MTIRVEHTEHCTLYCGDCLDVLPTLGKVDSVVTDPPYGVGLGSRNNPANDSSHLHKKGYESSDDTYEEFVSDVVPRINSAIAVADRSAVFTGPHIHEQQKPDAIGGIYVPCATGRTAWGSKQFLPILLYGKPSHMAGCHRPTVLVSTEAAEKSEHPCPKVLSWMEWLVDFCSEQGDLILDPFMGSGTTGVACVNTGRRFIGIEKEPKYFEIALRRIREAERMAKCDLFKEPKPVPQTQRSLIEV